MNRLESHVLSRARRLRSEPTPAERRLWSALRGRRFAGLKWRRQAPWGSCVLDFFCKDLRMVLEIDGGYHDDPEQEREDHFRRLSLERAGIKVVRLKNEEVLVDVDAVLAKIIRGAEAPAPQ